MRSTLLAGVLVLAACHPTVTARVSVVGDPTKDTSRGIPGTITGTLENRNAKGTLLDSRQFSYTAGRDVTFDFEAREGSTLVTVLEYPGGPKERRDPLDVPTHHKGEPWPITISVRAVDLADQKASIDALKSMAEDLGLIEKGAPGTGVTTPPSTNYEQVAKYIGGLAIMPKDWKPDGGAISAYHAIVSVVKAPPPPSPAPPIKKTLNVTTDTTASAALNVPVYGSLGAGIASGEVYRMKFDIGHSALLALDSGIFEVLLNPASKEAEAALAQLDLWARLYPDARVLTLRAMRYVSNGTIGVTKGRQYRTNLEAAVASVFSTNAAHSFSLDDELFIPLTGAVTAWQWHQQDAPLKKFVATLKAQRSTGRSVTPTLLPTDARDPFPASDVPLLSVP